MNMAVKQPPRDGEFGHDFAAIPRPAAGAITMASYRNNLRLALKQFTPEMLAHELARALLDATGSKGKAFNVLDAAMKEVMK